MSTRRRKIVTRYLYEDDALTDCKVAIKIRQDVKSMRFVVALDVKLRNFLQTQLLPLQTYRDFGLGDKFLGEFLDFLVVGGRKEEDLTIPTLPRQKSI